MRIYDAVLFIFLFNVALSMMIGLDMFEGVRPIQPNDLLIDRFDPASDTRLNQSLNKPPVDSGTAQDQNFGDFFGGMSIFLSAFGYATIGIFSMFNGLFPGAPALATTISVIIYFIYGAGIVQIIFNRSFKVNQ